MSVMAVARLGCQLVALLSVLAANFTTAQEVASAPEASTLAAGMRIYREGILPSGAPLRAIGQNGIALSAADAACINCHRRSGYGSSEGQNVIRPLPPLFGATGEIAAPLRARPVDTLFVCKLFFCDFCAFLLMLE